MPHRSSAQGGDAHSALPLAPVESLKLVKNLIGLPICDRWFTPSRSKFRLPHLNVVYGLFIRWTHEINPMDFGNVRLSCFSTFCRLCTNFPDVQSRQEETRLSGVKPDWPGCSEVDWSKECLDGGAHHAADPDFSSGFHPSSFPSDFFPLGFFYLLSPSLFHPLPPCYPFMSC